MKKAVDKLLSRLNDLNINKPDECEGEDLISQLPDNILHVILSSVKIDEAARMSICSRRWRYLWTHRTNLNFDPTDFMLVPRLLIGPSVDTNRYVNCINQVLNSYRGPSIDNFKLVWFSFGLSKYTGDFERWVRFAFSKRVKHLELNLTRTEGFTYSLRLSIFNCSPSVDSGITSLTSLSLTNVDVSGEFLEFILMRCHLLEQLFLERSKELVRFMVSSHKLKHLTILRCPKLEDLEIDAMELVSFRYYSVIRRPACLVVSRAPALAEAYLGWQNNAGVALPDYIFEQMSCVFMQLLKLSIDLSKGHWKIPIVLPSFDNVEYLELVILGRYLNKLRTVLRFMNACPVLQKFKVKTIWDEPLIPPEALKLKCFDAKLERAPMSEHEYYAYSRVYYGKEYSESLLEVEGSESEGEQHWANTSLKVFEMDIFAGTDDDVALLLKIVDSSPNLENHLQRK